MRSRRHIALPAALVLVAAIAAGCGQQATTGGSEDESGSPSPSRQRAEVSPKDADSEPAAAAPAVAPATTAAELAQRLMDAEDTTRGATELGPEVREAGFEAQVLYRQLARQKGWQKAVLAAVCGKYRSTVRAHLYARKELRSMHSALTDTLPAWRIVNPAPAQDLLDYYEEGQQRYGVPWEILAAVNLVETGLGRIRGTSTAGAKGPMQFIPETWAAYGKGDINDPHDAIMAAARYLAHNGGDRDIDGALYAYNNHPAYVAAVKAYASILREDPRAFNGLYFWQVLYLSSIGEIWLPMGYDHRIEVPVKAYVAEHPSRWLSASTD